MHPHPRVSLSMLSSWNRSVDQDLAFYARAGVTTIGASLAKMEADGIESSVAAVQASGLRVANLIGIGPFRLDEPASWPEQRKRVRAALDTAVALHAECLVLTTGCAGQLTWEDAADAWGEAMGPVLDDAVTRGVALAIEHTNSLRVDVGFLHTLRDCIDLARRYGIGVCMEINACWAERHLARTIVEGADALRLVQVSDYAIGTLTTPARLVPGDGDIPIERIVAQVLDAGYTGCFDLELIGPAIEQEGYESSSTRAVEYLSNLLTRLGA